MLVKQTTTLTIAVSTTTNSCSARYPTRLKNGTSSAKKSSTSWSAASHETRTTRKSMEVQPSLKPHPVKKNWLQNNKSVTALSKPTTCKCPRITPIKTSCLVSPRLQTVSRKQSLSLKVKSICGYLPLKGSEVRSKLVHRPYLQVRIPSVQTEKPAVGQRQVCLMVPNST